MDERRFNYLLSQIADGDDSDAMRPDGAVASCRQGGRRQGDRALDICGCTFKYLVLFSEKLIEIQESWFHANESILKDILSVTLVQSAHFARPSVAQR